MKEPDQCCLSSRHDDPSSVFFLTTHMNHTLTFCWLDSIRNKLKWAKFSYAKELRRIIGKTCFLFDLPCCNGKLYAFNYLQGDASVIEIDIVVEEQKVVIRLLPFMEHLGFSFNRFSQTNGSKDFDRYLKVPTGGMSSWGMLECRLGGDHVNLKQEEDKDDGNIVVKSGMNAKALSNSKKRTSINESHLLIMPFHILEMIMEHCVCVEYMNFRATCKPCHLAAPSVQWSNKTTLKSLQTYSMASPWLMVFDKYQGIITLSDPVMGA
ncbi:hypothetical protein Tco_0608691 [Tanacetum coccineum]